MADVPQFSMHSDRPIYTIRTVVQHTGITPATLRAWERRYGVLSPGRSDGGYRLYSERDIAMLQWLRRQVEGGVAISSAVALLEIASQASAATAARHSTSAATGVSPQPYSPRNLSVDLAGALVSFQEAQAEALLNQAFTLYPVETVTEEVITSALVDIGERWHRHEVTIAQEHFATAFLHGRVAALFHAFEQSSTGPLALTGCAPNEWHDVGILLVSLALRRNGWRVIFLGQNVPADQWTQAISQLSPRLICLSATAIENALRLTPITEALAALPEPRPILALGGRAFAGHPELIERFPDVVSATSASSLVAQL